MRRNRSIFEQWLACYTQEEIADREGLDHSTVTRIVCEFSDLKNCTKSDLARAEHATDFDAPLYNIWKQQTKSAGSEHFGKQLTLVLFETTRQQRVEYRVAAIPEAVAQSAASSWRSPRGRRV